MNGRLSFHNSCTVFSFPGSLLLVCLRCSIFSLFGSVPGSILSTLDKNKHTHNYIYIYIYMYRTNIFPSNFELFFRRVNFVQIFLREETTERERERERGREGEGEGGRNDICVWSHWSNYFSLRCEFDSRPTI